MDCIDPSFIGHVQIQGGTCLSLVQFLSFLYSFQEKNWPNNRLTPLPLELVFPWEILNRQC